MLKSITVKAITNALEEAEYEYADNLHEIISNMKQGVQSDTLPHGEAKIANTKYFIVRNEEAVTVESRHGNGDHEQLCAIKATMYFKVIAQTVFTFIGCYEAV